MAMATVEMVRSRKSKSRASQLPGFGHDKCEELRAYIHGGVGLVGERKEGGDGRMVVVHGLGI